MKSLAALMILILCFSVAHIAVADWSDYERVNEITGDGQIARHDESGWAMGVDDSLVIQLTWEGKVGRAIEVYYRSKEIRGSWRGLQEEDVTGEDTQSGAPGHSSIVNYKYDGYFKSLIAYASQKVVANEYKGRILNRDTPQDPWSDNFLFLSEEGDRIMRAGSHGGEKTGSLANNGANMIFIAWPYTADTTIVGSDTILYQTIWYNIMDSTGSLSGEGRVLASDSAYWGQDVCPYADPDNNIHLAYSRSDTITRYPSNIYWIKYNFSTSSFNSPTKLSNAGSNTKAFLPYVISWDKGGGDYMLHFVWQEESGSTNRVLYTNYGSQSGLKSSPDTVVSDDAHLPTIAATPDGKLCLVWEDHSGDNITLSYKYADPPSFNWGNTSTISPGTLDSLTYPLIIADYVGNFHLVCAGCSDSTDRDVFYFLNDMPPPPPTNLRESLTGGDNPHPAIMWDYSLETNISVYQVYRSLDNQNWSHIGSTTGNNYIDSTVIEDPSGPSVAYYYVRAKDSLDQLSIPSNTVYFQIKKPEKPSIMSVVGDFELYGNFPNPFNAQTTIEYNIPFETYVKIEIFDILGRKIETLVSDRRPTGLNKVIWKADNIASGMYFYRLQAEDYTAIRRMSIIK